MSLCLGFLLALVSLEAIALHAVAEPGAHHAGLVWRLLVPVGVLGLALLLPARWRWLVLGVTGLLCTFMIAGDLAYHEFFGTVTSAFMLSSIAQLLDVEASVHALVSPRNLLPALLFLPFLGLAAWPSVDSLRLRRGQRAGVALLGVEAILLLVAFNVPIYEETHHIGRSPWVRPSEHWGSKYSRLTYASTFGIFAYHFTDLRDYLVSELSEPRIDDHARADVLETLAHKKKLNDASSPLFGIARGRHVVLLQLESLQHFLLDLEVSGHEVMPNLDRLKRTSLNWDYVLDVTHIGRTSDAEFAVMTGLYPDVRKPIAAYHFPDGMVTLPNRLAKAGYRSSSVHGFKRAFWNRAYSHPAYGIEEMFFDEVFDDSDRIGLGPSDQQVFHFAADLLASRRAEPQFLFIISLTSHHPYLSVPAEWMKPYAALDPNEGYGLLAPYLGSASYTDAAVGSFFARLEELGILEDCLIVIYGDHDRGTLGETRPIPELGEKMFGPGEDRIPFLIAIPGEEARIAEYRTRFEGVMGGLVDVLPTVLHLLGEETPSGVVGTNLLVPNELRDPLPLPGSPGFFGYRGVLALGNGGVLRSKAAPRQLERMPTAEEALRDRVVAENLLDHYAELFPASAKQDIDGPSRAERLRDLQLSSTSRERPTRPTRR